MQLGTTRRIATAALLLLSMAVPASAGPPADGNPLVGGGTPIIAIWQESAGFGPTGWEPCLRAAVWADGRAVFGKDPKAWGRDLLVGRIAAPRLARLRREVRATGVFALKGTAYLVPDAEVDCISLRFDGMKQTLYWDEFESPTYGANSRPTPNYLAMKKAWRAVNKLVTEALPRQAAPLPGRFKQPPRSWYTKRAIQSN
jgi:hypothetical protein